MNLKVLPRSAVENAIRQSRVESAGPFGCLSCVHCEHESDGDCGQYQWDTCTKSPHLNEKEHGFPFKVAPGCFELNTECSDAWSGLQWHESIIDPKEFYPKHPGVPALIRNTDNFGNICQSESTPEMIDAIYIAMTEVIPWDGEDCEWRGMQGCTYEHETRFGWSLSGYGEDIDSYESGKYLPVDMESAHSYVETLMREHEIRAIIGKMSSQPKAAS